MAFDTYKAVKNLEVAGLEEEQAAAIVAVMRWAITGRYTSYAEFSETRTTRRVLEFLWCRVFGATNYRCIDV